MIVNPSFLSKSHTVDFPHAIPPVSPITYILIPKKKPMQETMLRSMLAYNGTLNRRVNKKY
jgi:hypothetical protein